MGEVTVQRHGYRSLFWPIVLIAVGVIWLLGNLGIISGANIIVLLRLWPLMLIIVGLDLLFGRQSPALGALIGVGAVVLIVVLMLVGPSMGLAGVDLDVKQDNFSESLGDAESADINLDMGVAEVSVSALDDSANLFEADLRYVGEVSFETEGETQKTIRLRSEQEQVDFFQGLDFLGAAFNTADNVRWDIGLSPNVPLTLNISAGVGTSLLDLSALEIQNLNVNSGVGQIDLRLPASEEIYTVQINGGVGEILVQVAEDAALNLNIDSGVGSVSIDLPEDAAVRIQAESGLGGIDLPGSFEQVSGDDDVIGQEGVWQTANYANADRRINIEFDGGVGGLNIH